MDAAYDAAKAGKADKLSGIALERIAQDRINNPHAMLNLSETTKDPTWMSKYDAIHGGTPAVWRVVEHATDEGDGQAGQQEVVLTIQGIIAKKDLPPFEEKISPSSTHVQFLRQSVTLIGLDMPTFQRAVDNVLEIHALLGRSVGHNNLEQCGMISSFDNQASIEMSNRYFTPKKYAGQSQELEIPSCIDPKEHLRNAKGKYHVHIEDNVVHYYELATDRFGESRFIPTKPIKFQVGDIAEAQVSVILVPLREKKFKSTMVLRSLSIMDGSFTQHAVRQRLQQQHTRGNQSSASVSLKRRVGYMDEEIGTTKAKLGRMEIDDRVERRGAGDKDVSKDLD